LATEVEGRDRRDTRTWQYCLYTIEKVIADVEKEL